MVALAAVAIGIALLTVLLFPVVGIALLPVVSLAALVVVGWAFVVLTRGARSLPEHTTSPSEPHELGDER